MKKIKQELQEFSLLLNAVPTSLTVMFVMSVFAMNLLANKSVNLPFSWLALDSGILVSWICFLTMDMVTRRFGPKAATELSVFAILMNLFWCLLFFVGSQISGSWGESYVAGSEQVINTALDRTFGGTWYVLAGSTAAFFLSSVVNNFLNWGIGRCIRKKADGFGAYALRTYVSTAVAQFTDNMIFALLVSHVFFGWTLLQCVTCSLTGMLVEMLCEAVFSFFGYRVCRGWEARGVGKEYLQKVRKWEAA